MIERKNLELSVRDFGPIARADIDLRPLTVFVGPSNTGKSYLAILIYALHRFFNSYSTHPKRFLPMDGNVVDFSDLPNISEESDADLNALDLFNWIDSVYRQAGTMSGLGEGFPVRVPGFIVEAIAPLLRNMGTLGYQLDSEIARCFGMSDTHSLIRHASRDSSLVAIKRHVQDASSSTETFEYEFARQRTGPEFAVSIPDSAPLFFDEKDSEEIEDLLERALYFRYPSSHSEAGLLSKETETLFFVNRFLMLVESFIREPFNWPARYLPADRAGVMHTHRLSVGSLIERAAYPGVSSVENTPAIPGVIADFLGQLVELDRWGNRWDEKSENIELAECIERNILKGAVRFENSVTGYPVFFYRPEGWKEDMPLMNTSSSVSELAPVVLYLRHVVRPGETLIIEEPESHLHPAMQVEFTRQLAAVVRAGVRVIITTHSEWVLDELTNLVRLWELPESRRKGIGGADYALDPKQVGVWLFEPKRRPRGSVVKEIPFDEDFGGFRSGFDEVAMGTYNDYAAISNRKERSGS